MAYSDPLTITTDERTANRSAVECHFDQLEPIKVKGKKFKLRIFRPQPPQLNVHIFQEQLSQGHIHCPWQHASQVSELADHEILKVRKWIDLQYVHNLVDGTLPNLKNFWECGGPLLFTGTRGRLLLKIQLIVI